MAIAFRAATGGKNEAAGTDVNITVPVGVQAGDALILFYWLSGTTVTAVSPSGFSLIDGPFDKGTVLRAYAFQKVATGAEAGNTLTVAASASSATKRYVNLVAYSGTDTTAPVQTYQAFVEVTAGTTHTAPNVAVTGSGSWVLEAFADRGSPGSTSWTVPGGFTKRDEQVGTGGGALTTAVAGTAAPVSAGVNGGDTWTSASGLSTASAVGWTLALNPLVVGPPAPQWTYSYDVRVGG